MFYSDIRIFMMRCKVWHHLYNTWNPATLLKETLLHGCFSRFSNCANGTKLRKTSRYSALSKWTNALASLIALFSLPNLTPDSLQLQSNQCPAWKTIQHSGNNKTDICLQTCRLELYLMKLRQREDTVIRKVSVLEK